MAYENKGLDLGFTAFEDLSAMQHRFVTLQDDGSVRMLDSGSEWPAGILQNAPAQGETAVVRVSGVSKLAAGAGGLTRGACVAAEYIGASDNGKGIVTTTGGANVRARVLLAATAEDNLASVLLTDGKYYGGA
jgi:hypothetical protein